MKKFRRLLTAFGRYRSGKGFGIHSPFAFNFTLKVLEERCPYYAYEVIKEKRHIAASATKKHVLPESEARRIFRITNYFNPQRILQIGSDCGIAAVSALNVSGKSRMWLYNPSGDAAAYRLLEEYSGRVDFHKSATVCIDNYFSEAQAAPFIIIGDIEGGDYPLILSSLKKAVTGKCTIIVCNIERRETISRLWDETTGAMTTGMSFSNGKLGVIVCDDKLPLSHYSLWF